MPDPKCPHTTTIIKNLCSTCGAFVNNQSESYKAGGRVALLHNVPDLFVSQDLADRIGNNDRQRLLKSKKLILIIDLDHTILHSSTIYVKDMKLINMKQHQSMVDKIVDMNKKDYLSYTHENYFQYTFFRKNLRKFLKDLHPYFEFHIFTMGTRDYVKPIMDYLDPKGKWFGSRIKTRDECQIENNKYIELKSIFPCTSHLVCILDDRLDVWFHSSNVLQIYPYENKYVLALNQEFIGEAILDPSFAINNSSKEIIDESTVLDLHSKILKNIHYNFYQQLTTLPTIRTKDIIYQVRQSILSKEYTFYLDNNLLRPIADTRLNSLTYKLKSMGGNVVKPKICSDIFTHTAAHTIAHMDPVRQKITHIIVDKRIQLTQEREKIINQIRNLNADIKLVHFEWIYVCYYQWKYVSEDSHHYLVEIDDFMKKLPSLEILPEKRVNNTSIIENDQQNNLNISPNKKFKVPKNDDKLCVDKPCDIEKLCDNDNSNKQCEIEKLSDTDKKCDVDKLNDVEKLCDNDNSNKQCEIEKLSDTDKKCDIDKLNDVDKLCDNENCEIKKLDLDNNAGDNKSEFKDKNKYYNEKDIDSMADELENFLE